jgi:signal transduction histidine kinase
MNFQYRMEGIEAWSPPTEQQTVLYPRLAPGTYRFLVRAASSDGVATETTPASVTLTIPRPVWARWWFLATAAAGIILAVHAAYRYRLGQLLEIERIRTRLAMDLHDDIGSALSQVAVMSAVAKQRAGGQQGLAELLERIAERSRQVMDTMSDVVWAINPERDSLRDLAQRMRRFTAETLEGQDIELQLELPPESVDVRLGAEVRREVFLIFKEGINNLVRYAKCSRATVGLHVEGASLVLTVRDDGVGFDPAAPSDGLGLRSMRERAGRLGARPQNTAAQHRDPRVLIMAQPLQHRGTVSS